MDQNAKERTNHAPKLVKNGLRINNSSLNNIQKNVAYLEKLRVLYL